eukprot:152930-Chlamydomonas_euryale.AAC.2
MSSALDAPAEPQHSRYVGDRRGSSLAATLSSAWCVVASVRPAYRTKGHGASSRVLGWPTDWRGGHGQVERMRVQAGREWGEGRQATNGSRKHDRVDVWSQASGEA